MSVGTDYAITFTAAEQAELLPVERNPAPLGPNEVSGRTLASLVSAGTELMGAYLGTKFPVHPGYASAFQVEEVGDAVTNVKPGDMAFCSGSHRSYQRATADRVLKVPEGVAPTDVPFCRLMGVSMSTLTTTKARPPAQVVVTGLGLVGHLAARVFESCGYEVTGCDPHAGRREMAERAGLRRVLPAVPVGDAEYQDRVSLVLECSGHEAGAVEACKLVRKKGEVALIGAPWKRRTELYAHELLNLVFFRYVVLRSGWEWELPLDPTEFRENSIFENYAAALRWLAAGRLSVEGLYTPSSPADAQQAYQDLLHQRTERLAVVFDWTKITS
jgi:threonine dehydrogenase-like Zn-dependent dehydrogenase